MCAKTILQVEGKFSDVHVGDFEKCYKGLVAYAGAVEKSFLFLNQLLLWKFEFLKEELLGGYLYGSVFLLEEESSPPVIGPGSPRVPAPRMAVVQTSVDVTIYNNGYAEFDETVSLNFDTDVSWIVKKLRPEAG